MDEILTLIEKTAFLKGLPGATTIPTEAIAELASRATEIHCAPGDVLFREGDPDRGSFVVIDGSLELRKGSALVLVLKRGMSVGELSHGEGEPHQYTLIAAEHSHVLNLTREDTLDSMLDYPEMAVEVVRTLGQRFHELASRVLELEAANARLRDALLAAGLVPPDSGPSPATRVTTVPDEDTTRRTSR
jgi:CRP-like cAMP-binding protein